MDILELASTDGIRALLGADPGELTDATIASSGAQEELYMDLSSWIPLPDTVETLISAGTGAAPGSDAHLKLMRLMAYSRAFCAYFLFPSMSNWRLTQISDGNSVTEQRKTALDPILGRSLADSMARHKGALLGLLQAVETTPQVRSFSLAGKSTPTSDPVLGTR